MFLKECYKFKTYGRVYLVDSVREINVGQRRRNTRVERLLCAVRHCDFGLCICCNGRVDSKSVYSKCLSLIVDLISMLLMSGN